MRTNPVACSPDAAATLLVQSMKGNEIVACACERATRAGVRADMTVAHACSLLRGCSIHREPFAPGEDLQSLQRLARWALRFSPLVCVDEPGGLLLNIAGCSHLYGGERKLAEQIGESITELGLEACIAVAPSFACAQAVATFSGQKMTLITDNPQAALHSLPVAALRVNKKTCDELREIGIERIGQLFDLPRAQLASRFDGELTRRMDQALGAGWTEVLEPIRLLEPLEVSRAFEGAATCGEAVQTACRELLGDLVQCLSRQESGLCSLRYLFHRIDSASIPLSLRLSHPTRDFKHLWSLLHPRLERLNIGYGIQEIHLRANRAERIEHGQVELWPDLPAAKDVLHQSSWPQLLDHLIERLGLENVMVAESVETYAPEKAFGFSSWKEDRKKFRQAHSTQRPSRLFERPELIEVMTMTPDGPLLWLHWRGREHRVYRCMGPERISLSWWKTSSPASTRLFRDYYMVMDMEGECLWVYRDGQTGTWFVHGEWT